MSGSSGPRRNGTVTRDLFLYFQLSNKHAAVQKVLTETAKLRKSQLENIR